MRREGRPKNPKSHRKGRTSVNLTPMAQNALKIAMHSHTFNFSEFVCHKLIEEYNPGVRGEKAMIRERLKELAKKQKAAVDIAAKRYAPELIHLQKKYMELCGMETEEEAPVQMQTS